MPPRTRKDDSAPPQTVEGEQPLPNMPEPPAPEEPEIVGDPELVDVFVAWGRVMRDVGKIGKNRRNTDQNFNFRGVDDVVNVVGPALRKHGVFIVAEEVEVLESERYETIPKNGRPRGTIMHGLLTREHWRVYGPKGDSFPLQSLGQSADSGDKVAAKAQSVAYRVVLLQALAIPTDDRDPDADAHERANGSEEGTQDRRGRSQQNEQTTEPADPRTGRWNEIIAKGKTLDPPLDTPAIGRDFRAWRGYAINAPEVTVSDLVRYLAIMPTPPAERPAYVPTPDDERHVAEVQQAKQTAEADAAIQTREGQS